MVMVVAARAAEVPQLEREHGLTELLYLLGELSKFSSEILVLQIEPSHYLQ
jgi:hypothetical protein